MTMERRSSDILLEKLIDSVQSVATNVAVLTERMDNQYHAMNNKLAVHFASDEHNQMDLTRRLDGQNKRIDDTSEEVESLKLSRAKGQGVLAAAGVAGASGGGVIVFLVEHMPKWFK